MKRLLLLPGLALVLAGLVLLLLPREELPGGAAGVEALAQKSRAPGLPVYGKVIGREDLPPDGTRSLFDHLVRENGSLPFPFERVIELLASYDADGRQPRSLLIPDGRSLLKGHADFRRPRIVVAADAAPPAGAMLSPILRGRLFLGFVEGGDEIEVISYNELAGRFEFQLVENYCAGCVPRIVYARRAICTTCHAGEGPIFPVRPWQETNAQPAIAQRIARYNDGDAYHGAPLRRTLDDAQGFDNLTDSGNVIPVTQKIWLDGCGEEGTDCRRQMLALALRYVTNPAALDRATEASRTLLELQQRHWPAQGIAMDNGNLSNRDPLEQALYDQSFGAQLRNLLFPRDELPVVTGDRVKDFDALPPLPGEFDPLRRRSPLKEILAGDLDGVYGVAQLFAPGDVDRLEQAAAYDAERLLAAVDALPDELFEARPLRRVVMVRTLLAALGAPVPEYCCLSTEGMSAPSVQGEPPLELAAGSVLQPFQEYCFACHRGNPAARLDFMSGASESEVLDKIQSLEKLDEVLDYERYLGTQKAGQLMPPEDSWQRQALNEALDSGQDPLAEMREQAPSLFDF